MLVFPIIVWALASLFDILTRIVYLLVPTPNDCVNLGGGTIHKHLHVWTLDRRKIKINNLRELEFPSVHQELMSDHVHAWNCWPRRKSTTNESSDRWKWRHSNVVAATRSVRTKKSGGRPCFSAWRTGQSISKRQNFDRPDWWSAILVVPAKKFEQQRHLHAIMNWMNIHPRKVGRDLLRLRFNRCFVICKSIFFFLKRATMVPTLINPQHKSKKIRFKKKKLAHISGKSPNLENERATLS